MTPRRFYSADEFDWTAHLTDAYEELRDELCNLDIATPVYESYIERIASEKSAAFWDASTLIFFTIQNPALVEMAPKTAAAVLSVPGVVTAQVLDLGPNTHLKAHCGYSPDTLRFHLGIDVPEPDKCSLRVEDETGAWANGEWLIFDDYLEHEVWNRGQKSRKVLLIDTVRPGVEHDAKTVAKRFFKNAPGTNFDGVLSKVGSREQWLEWIELGEFA